MKKQTISADINNGFIVDCTCFHADLTDLSLKVTSNPYDDANIFAIQSALTSDSLPLLLRHKLYDFYLNGNEEGVLLLKNLPQDENIIHIPTPETHSVKKTYISEFYLAMIGSRLGEVFGYRQIENGMFIQDVVPKRGMENEQSYAGSKVELMFHTEQHFHPYSPDYLLLYCLRSGSDSKTFFSSIRQFDILIDKYSRLLLFEPLYQTGIDHVFGNTKTEKGNGPLMPILFGNLDDPYIRYDLDLMIGATKESQSALKVLLKAMQQMKQSVCLTAGDLLIIDNRRTVHGRSSFVAKFDGKDRWLQRIKVMRDIDKTVSSYSQNKRIVETTSF